MAAVSGGEGSHLDECIAEVALDLADFLVYAQRLFPVARILQAEGQFVFEVEGFLRGEPVQGGAGRKDLDGVLQVALVPVADSLQGKSVRMAFRCPGRGLELGNGII